MDVHKIVDTEQLNTKIMHKKYNYIYSKMEKKIGKIQSVFFNLRTIMNTGGHNHKSLEKMYKGIIKSGTAIEDGLSKQFVSVYDRKDTSKLKYEIKYGISGVSIQVTDDQYHSGIQYAKFSDFDCKNLKEVIYNYHVPDRIEIYRMYIAEDKTIKVKFSFKNKENINWLGKIWAFLRAGKYIY